MMVFADIGQVDIERCLSIAKHCLALTPKSLFEAASFIDIHLSPVRSGHDVPIDLRANEPCCRMSWTDFILMRPRSFVLDLREGYLRGHFIQSFGVKGTSKHDLSSSLSQAFMTVMMFPRHYEFMVLVMDETIETGTIQSAVNSLQSCRISRLMLLDLDSTPSHHLFCCCEPKDIGLFKCPMG